MADAATVALIAAAALWMVLFLPRYLLSWDLAGGTIGSGDRAAAVNAIRSTLMQGLAGLAVLAGLFFTWRQVPGVAGPGRPDPQRPGLQRPGRG